MGIDKVGIEKVGINQLNNETVGPSTVDDLGLLFDLQAGPILVSTLVIMHKKYDTTPTKSVCSRQSSF